MKRILYVFYYLKETDLRQIRSFIRYASAKSGRAKITIVADMVVSAFIYNVSLKDYFCFRFFELCDVGRKEWAGTGYMYQYQLLMNPKGAREVLQNKIKFLNHFRSVIKRRFYSLHELKEDARMTGQMLQNSSGLLVLKGSRGQVGAEVKIIKCDDYTVTSIIDYMKKHNYDLIEEYVVQHRELMALSPSGLNTVRIITQLHDGSVQILGARLRISVNSAVDNMAAGNLAAPIDPITGIVNGPGVYSDITKEDQSFHPVTGKAIMGLVLPFWAEVIELVKMAAKAVPDNKSVGWDIAITENGPELIEGNHNWCKLLWQMPVKRGLKKEIQKYL
ncbi:MAG: hypothetical protein JXB49_06160 [Bacteroidales bacterium]|nr:hypothetical protein [Bacteroidales bacterium]